MAEYNISQQTFQALARELKDPLVSIARQAELLNLSSVALQANSAMNLVDGFLLTSKSEYGQVRLDLEPLDIGSVFNQVCNQNRDLAKENQIGIKLDIAQNNLVMANRRVLEVGLGCLAQLAIDQPRDSSVKEVRLVSYKKRDGNVIAGVFSANFVLSTKDIARAERLYGFSHQATNTSLSGSGIRLAVADQLARSLGARLLSLKRNNIRGLGLELMKSEQMKLV